MKKTKICIIILYLVSILAISVSADSSSIYLDITFIANWFFNIYDVEVYLDNEYIDTISHGTDYSKLITDVQNGEHRLLLRCYDNSEIYGYKDIAVNGDVTYQFTISINDEKISIDNMNVYNDVHLSQLHLPLMFGKVAQDASEEIKELGFTNTECIDINTGISIYGLSDWTVIDQNISSEEAVDKTEKIILQCVKTQNFMSDIFQKLTPKEAYIKAWELGYNTRFFDANNKRDLEAKFGYLQENEISGWIVDSLSVNNINKMVTFNMKYVEKVTMPNVLNCSLQSAIDYLKELNFSDVQYESINGERVNDKVMWTVNSQNIEPGNSVEATKQIILTVRPVDVMNKVSDESRIKTQNEYQVILNDIEEQKRSEGQREEKRDEVKKIEEEQKMEEQRKVDSEKTNRTNSNKSVALDYTTNDSETAKNGNMGLYAYIKKGPNYNSYYIIDFTGNCVYYFNDGNGDETCDRIQIDEGDLNSVLIITYHDGTDVFSEGLHFKWKNQPDRLIVQLSRGDEYEFRPTNLVSALKIRDSKRTIDY